MADGKKGMEFNAENFRIVGEASSAMSEKTTVQGLTTLSGPGGGQRLRLWGGLVCVMLLAVGVVGLCYVPSRCGESDGMPDQYDARKLSDDESNGCGSMSSASSADLSSDSTEDDTVLEQLVDREKNQIREFLAFAADQEKNAILDLHNFKCDKLADSFEGPRGKVFKEMETMSFKRKPAGWAHMGTEGEHWGRHLFAHELGFIARRMKTLGGQFVLRVARSGTAKGVKGIMKEGNDLIKSVVVVEGNSDCLLEYGFHLGKEAPNPLTRF